MGDLMDTYRKKRQQIPFYPAKQRIQKDRNKKQRMDFQFQKIKKALTLTADENKDRNKADAAKYTAPPNKRRKKKKA